MSSPHDINKALLAFNNGEGLKKFSKSAALKKKMIRVEHKGKIGHRISDIGAGRKEHNIEEHDWHK